MTDISVSPKEYHIILSNRNMAHYGEIQNIDQSTVNVNLNFNSADELSFTVYKTLNNRECRLWDKIVDLKLGYVAELNEYFQIETPLTDADSTYKTVTGTSLCEAELGQIILRSVYINTEYDIDRDDYVPTIFCDPNKPEGSLLHRILKFAPHYHIGHVDDSLKTLQRTFETDGTSIYDFFTGDCAEQFNCIFIFDTPTRTINVYDLYTVCNKCGHRGEYDYVCPKCGSDDLKYYGEDTTIAVSKENLTEEINYSTDVDSIKNCFKLVAGDDDMTATVINNNPNGSSYYWAWSDFQKEDMSEELRNKLTSYNKLYESKQPEYSKIMENVYNCIDKIGYYTSSMMPDHEHPVITAASEAEKLNNTSLSPLGLSSVTTSTSIATVESALKNYAKVYVKSAYVKLEIVEGEWDYEGTDENGNHYGYWKGRIKVTNYSDEEDVAYSDYLNIKVYDLYEDFLKQKIDKVIAKENDDEGSIYDVLSIKVYEEDGKTEDQEATLEKFKEALTYYSLNRLKAFHDAVQSCIDIMIQEDQASEMADLYNTMYKPYKAKLDAIQEEMDKRQVTIDEWNKKYNDYTSQQQTIQKELNFESYLGKDLFLEMSAYRRDDTYQNDNFISDGLDNAELFKKANEFLDAAKKEILKACTPQHTITSTLYNLLKLPAFKPLVNHFKLGNWIRFLIDGHVYRLRLIKIGYDNSDDTKLTTEFSNLTVSPDVKSDVASILSAAQSMSTSYSYVAKQAEIGNKAQSALVDIQKNGLDTSLYEIKNADNQELTYSKHGLLFRKHDDNTDTYDPEQLVVTGNKIAFTRNTWESVSSVIGKQKYSLNGITYEKYGVNVDFMLSGEIISGDIYSLNYKTDSDGNITNGTHIDLEKGNFDFAGGKLHYNSDENVLEMTGLIKGSRIEGGSLLIGDMNSNHYAEIDENGNMTAAGVTIIGGTFESGDLGMSFEKVHIKNSDINGGSLSVSNADKSVYTEISTDGLLSAKGCNISGTFSGTFDGTFDGVLDLTNGSIAGRKINTTSLYFDNGSKSSGVNSNGSYSFWAGSTYANRNSAPLRVSHTGNVYATDVIIGSTKSSNFKFDGINIVGSNALNYQTVTISNDDGSITLYDENGENEATISPNKIELTNPNSQLIINGTKSRITSTEHYGDRLLYCYEMTEPMFGDIGESVVNADGFVYITLDPIFVETVNTVENKYYVSLTPYGKGELYIYDLCSDNFVVCGKPGLKFSWEVKAKQRGFESMRLEKQNKEKME